jgi:hypothetical protein
MKVTVISSPTLTAVGLRKAFGQLVVVKLGRPDEARVEFEPPPR